MVELQNNATKSMLYTAMEAQICTLSIQRDLMLKIMQGDIIINSKFRKPVLNIQRTYNQNEDPYLLSLYKNKASYLISSWIPDDQLTYQHQKDTLVQEELNQLSKDQLRNSSIIDFVQRASLFANRMSSNSQKAVKMIIESYYQAFSSDGMFFGTGANMTYQNFTDQPPCLQSKYHLDSRCQEFFIASLLKPQLIMAGYSPIKFNYNNNNQPLVAMGLCKKIYTPSNYNQFYYGFLNSNQSIFSIICNAVQLEQSQLDFQKLGNNDALRIIIDYKLLKVAYQSNVQMSPNTIYTLQDTYLKKLDLDQYLNKFNPNNYHIYGLDIIISYIAKEANNQYEYCI
ncbi:tetratricopeptide repeat protein (macronuclear) [Tetrahymena thermophila SB210]|uniref:Tetratricopeptide repeat protein n=1 Tax=Tetrahymena thermophila (strain SB210) TaxID=312017 RepID=Q245R8_TETTS|nr:tetratricopeptide repeat protein [Tetrahymena thermophila SB210]EAS03565.2 tetratricopeptide repeat protein [Tetrahymena thermophila SB210]|eukprot:XP_001023810.2 tetratricopeptide repeat protein [Tetrahymena thermophila SB210]